MIEAEIGNHTPGDPPHTHTHTHTLVRSNTNTSPDANIHSMSLIRVIPQTTSGCKSLSLN